MVSESSVFTRALACACEVTYHRVPELNQIYYGCLLHELLAFQISERHQLEPVSSRGDCALGVLQGSGP